MDPVVNLEGAARAGEQGKRDPRSLAGGRRPPSWRFARLQDVALEFAELVQALDEWRVQGGFEPYTTRPVAPAPHWPAGGHGVRPGRPVRGVLPSRAARNGEDVLSFCERTPDGPLPLAELSPPREGYTPRGQTQG